MDPYRVSLRSASRLLNLLVFASFVVSAHGEAVNPFPRARLAPEPVLQWDFEGPFTSFTALNECFVGICEGSLAINAVGEDPYCVSPAMEVRGPLSIRFLARANGAGQAQIFWSEKGVPGFAEERSVRLPVQRDRQWGEYEVFLNTDATVDQIRIDPGSGKGIMEIDWMTVNRQPLHPLEIVSARAGTDTAEIDLHNHSDRPITFSVGGESLSLASSETVQLKQPLTTDRLFKPVSFLIEPMDPQGLPPLRRTVFAWRPDGKEEWIERTSGPLTLRVAPDGAGAHVVLDGRLVALIYPLVAVEGTIPPLQFTGGDHPTDDVTFAGGDIQLLSIKIEQDALHIILNASVPVEGPVVRALGELEQGLFAGVEYLGRREVSSSRLDLEGPEHIRHTPNRYWITMPLMSMVTDRGTVSMLWNDMNLQPSYAVPNCFDGASDGRMAIRGQQINTVVRVSAGYGQGGRLENEILWAVKRRGGLPPIPQWPRPANEQYKFCLKILNGPLWNNDGWSHCVGWPHQFFADHASAVYRLTGKAPDLRALVPGGAHIEDPSIYFVTGRADQWRDHLRQRARAVLREQKPDGSFRYDGKYQKGHFEDTASGLCAIKARMLLTDAYYNGDAQSLAAGLKALEFIERFRTPRGAQIWEMPLHTPDLLAAAHLVKVHVMAFELTGQRKYIEEARRWALTGVPFIYQWSGKPLMPYTTIAVLGATNWVAPVWMGMPVQWCGTVYADALLDLAPYDQTLDWRHLAEGITVASMQLQYPDGPHAGALPDGFIMDAQLRVPADINPSAIVHLQRRLETKPTGLYAARQGERLVVAPFPVTLREDFVCVEAVAGETYQLLINGEQVREVRSNGRDEIKLK